MTKTVAFVLIAGCTTIVHSAPVSDAEALEQARSALKTLSLEEKVSLCAGNGTFTLNAIPHAGLKDEWNFSDSSHTVSADHKRWDWGDLGSTNDFSTSLPTLSALAATWNVELAELFGHVMGEQTAARGKDQILGPGVNLMRTPLCGRNWEYMSEDPCLTAKLVVPEIRALQSHDVAACVKHYCLNNQENDRFQVNVIVDERTLNELYLEPFRAAVVDGGVWTLMSAYNRYNGQFISENDFLQRTVLRDRWGFKGQIVTDWGGQRSGVKAVLAGCGVEMNRGMDIRFLYNPKEGTYPLADAVRNGEVPEATVDDMALRVLWVMAKAKFIGGRHRARGSLNTSEHQFAGRWIAEESIALLKNRSNLLPLNHERIRRIMLIGSLADTCHCRQGWSASGKPPYEITPAAGIEEYFAKRGIKLELIRQPLSTADRTSIMSEINPDLLETFAADATAHQQRSWKAEYFTGCDPVGEPVVIDWPRKIDFDWGKNAPHAEKLFKTTGDNPAFCVRYTAKLVAPASGEFNFSSVTSWSWPVEANFTLDGQTVLARKRPDEKGRIQVDGKINLVKGRTYDAELIFRGCAKEGEINKVNLLWLVPTEAVSLDTLRREAETCDAVIAFTGTALGHGRALECEGGDRPDMKMADGTDEAIERLMSLCLTNLVVVNHSGSPMEMPWEEKCDTLVQTSYLGQDGGRALANVLFGKWNPCGRLPCSWPRKLEDTSVAHLGTLTPTNSVYGERFYIGYRWHDKSGIKPMFPFGYGLSYTTFSWSKPKTHRVKGGWEVAVEVTNTGKLAGKDVVEIYVSYPSAKVERCVKDLRSFAKTPMLRPGEKATVICRVSERDLAYWDVFEKRFRADSGKYTLLIARSAADTVADTTIKLDEDVVFKN